MNFFGHAVVASRICRDPEFVLGAMMPDFEGMIAETANRFTDVRVTAGVHAHHVTDSVFHNSGRFLRFQADARAALSTTPLRRGPRRAVAHVGVELLLDAALGAIEQRRDVYRQALNAGLRPQTLAGAPLLARAKLHALLTSLSARAAYVVPRTPQEALARLQRALGGRPALALSLAELPLVNEWLRLAWHPIAEEAEHWLNELVSAADSRLTHSHQSPSADEGCPSAALSTLI